MMIFGISVRPRGQRQGGRLSPCRRTGCLRRARTRVGAAVLLLLAGVTGLTGLPALAQAKNEDLSALSLEQLSQMEISVSSFSRREQDLWLTPAPVYIISREDIEKSPASSIPELLRGIPGLQVAQINASTWAVSARGFNSEYASKLLVLVDGRTVYSEIYSGTHWDEIDLALEAVERIEVIRGPGAAVWGTNAVNGVINIISRQTSHTTGTLVSGAASRIEDVATLGYGGSLGEKVGYRAFAKYVSRKPLVDPSGANGFDGEETWRTGGRLEWRRSGEQTVTLSGDLYGGDLKSQIIATIGVPDGPNGKEKDSMAGGYLSGLWEQKTETASRALKVYYNDQSRHELGSLARSRAVDFDYQDHPTAWRHHDLVWGGDLRYTANHLAGAALPTLLPDYGTYLANGFVQDEIALVPGRLMLTLGSKVEDGTQAGFQLQPSARLLWAPNHDQSAWAAVSRAAVAPSLQDRDLNLPLALGTQDGLTIVGRLLGNPAFKPETVVAFETGYRRRVGNNFTLDMAGFFNDNQRIQGLATTTTFQAIPVPSLRSTLEYTNGFRVRTGGFEASAKWKPRASLVFQGSYTWMEAHVVQVDSGMLRITDAWNAPHTSLMGTAAWSLGSRWTANGSMAYVGRLGDTNPGSAVPAYERLDLHVARKIGNWVMVEAGGTNLLSPRHLEFGGDTGFVTPFLVPRSFFIKGKWSF
jgi:iron complex outermembrane receptor protein